MVQVENKAVLSTLHSQDSTYPQFLLNVSANRGLRLFFVTLLGFYRIDNVSRSDQNPFAEEARLHPRPPHLPRVPGSIVANCNDLAQLLLTAGESPPNLLPKMETQSLPPRPR